MAPALATVTIGQSPRPDLLEQLLVRLPSDVEVLELGALDLVAADGLALLGNGPGRQDAGYPLTTRLRDGTPVTLDEKELAPLVQSAIDRGEEAGAGLTLLLCAGGFLRATAKGPLVRPFDAAVEQLRSLGARRLAVVVPFESQARAAHAKFLGMGFTAVTIVGDPADLDPSPIVADAIVLDYVGHPSASVDAVRRRARVPLLDLGECGAATAARLFIHHGGTPPSGVT